MFLNRYLYMYIPLNHGSLLGVYIARCAKPIAACQFGEVSANISQFNLYCFHWHSNLISQSRKYPPNNIQCMKLIGVHAE